MDYDKMTNIELYSSLDKIYNENRFIKRKLNDMKLTRWNKRKMLKHLIMFEGVKKENRKNFLNEMKKDIKITELQDIRMSGLWFVLLYKIDKTHLQYRPVGLKELVY